MKRSPGVRPVTLSRIYGYVRGLQLEGRYPRDVGLWPITCLRIEVGWGKLPNECWPRQPVEPWPPEEPPGLDQIAKSRRSGYYQRVRSSEDARRALSLGSKPVLIGLHLTRQWLRGGTDGKIGLPTADDEFVGDHGVVLEGYKDGYFQFWNSWGPRWGNSGYGLLPYDYVDKHMVEAHVMQVVPPPRRKGTALRWRGVSPLGHPQYGFYAQDEKNDERAGWAFAFERDGYLDIEELFVRPAYRRQGRGTMLAGELTRLAAELQLPLRAWISHADGDRAGISGVIAMTSRLGLTPQPSAALWARYLAVPAILGTSSVAMP